MWWLVSPRNPLKAPADLLPHGERLAAACRLAGEARVRVSGLEARLGTPYTCDTLRHLRRRAPATRFVWLMGADNLAGVHLWHRWHRIFAAMPVAVFDRAPYSFACLASRAAIRFGACRLDQRKASHLATRPAPCWTFVTGPRHPASASAIRAGETVADGAGRDDRIHRRRRALHS